MTEELGLYSMLHSLLQFFPDLFQLPHICPCHTNAFFSKSIVQLIFCLHHRSTRVCCLEVKKDVTLGLTTSSSANWGSQSWSHGT
jgi:hypothetical protein